VIKDARGNTAPTYVVEPNGRHVLVTAVAGKVWDDLVADTVEAGYSGIEAMSGIPGTVGAAPVQNIGAYGQDVSMTFHSMKALDRLTGEVSDFDAKALDFSYRNSLLKRSMHEHSTHDPKSPWQPSPRYVILEVTFRLDTGGQSKPILWVEMATNLGLQVGQTAPVAEVRAEVLRLREKRATLVDGFGGASPGNYDRWSCGSFFTNPIVPIGDAAALPKDMPRYPLGDHEVGGTEATHVQVPAAWLIENAGFYKGWGLPGSGAQVSHIHALALTNRGNATAQDVVELARAVRAGVKDKFGLDLVPEPNMIGVEI
jgi:UDP-N-acetylmuramate dehydrogenase